MIEQLINTIPTFAGYIFLAGGTLLNITALPTLLDEDAKVSPVTSATLILVLSVYTMTYFSLGIYLGALSSFIGIFVWAAILYYRK